MKDMVRDTPVLAASQSLFFYLETVPSSAELDSGQDRDTLDTLGRALIFEGDFKGTGSVQQHSSECPRQ